jgi:hypothetical protein
VSSSDYGYKEYEKGAEQNSSLTNFFGDKEAWKEKYLSPIIKTKDWDLITDELGKEGHTNIFNTKFFTKAFGQDLINLAEKSNCWTQKRHEFYPTTDMLLESINMNSTYEEILKEYLYPWAIHLWELEGKTWKALYGENFLIKYSTNKQAHLSLHHDYSIFTGLATLNDEYEGGGTYFKRQKICANPSTGTMSLHPGNVTHKHGARPITSGTRYVIVSFIRSKEPYAE